MFWFAFGRLFEENIVTTACGGVDALWVLDYGWGWANNKLSSISLLLFIFCFKFKVLLQLASHLIGQWLQFRHVWLHLSDDAIAWIYSCVCFWSQVAWLVFTTFVHKVAGSHVPDALRWVLKVYFAVKLAEKFGILLYANMVFAN
jgi:hypothetical protein